MTDSTKEMLEVIAPQLPSPMRVKITQKSVNLKRTGRDFIRGDVVHMNVAYEVIVYSISGMDWFPYLHPGDIISVGQASVFYSNKGYSGDFKANCLPLVEQIPGLIQEIQKRRNMLAFKGSPEVCSSAHVTSDKQYSPRIQLPIPGTNCEAVMITTDKKKSNESKSRNNDKRVTLTLRPDQKVFLSRLQYEEESMPDLLRRLVDYVAANMASFPEHIAPGGNAETGLTAGHVRARIDL